MGSARAVEELARRLGEQLPAGCLHRPGDAAYTAASTLWNAAVATRSALVVRPRTGGAVATAVTAARECGVGLSVRGGGHDWAGRALCEGGLVIDLGGMRTVRVEAEEAAGRVATVGGGSLAGDVVAAAAEHGANAATGTAGLVGMAGLTLGGGYGPLLGTAGLAADNLLGAEVVLADGRLVSTEDDPELLWALRGGGGNFGAVTSMRIRLHPDRGLVGGTVLFPWGEASAVLARYAELAADAPEGLTVLLELTYVPDLGPALLAVPVWSGERGGADAALAEVLSLGTPLTSDIGPVTQQALLARFDGMVPQGMHWDLRTRTVAALTPGIVEVLLGAAEARPGPGAGIGLRQFHGAATRVGSDETAFGLRTPHLVVEISAGRGPEEDAAAYRAWAEETRAALESYALPGGYPNFLLPEQKQQVAHAYGAHAERLRAAKAAYDPRGVFTATPLPGPADAL